MPRITQQIMIMIFFCSVGRKGRGDGECWGRMDPGVWHSSLSCSPWPVVGSEQHLGSRKDSGSSGQGGTPMLLLLFWVGRAELVPLRSPS